MKRVICLLLALVLALGLTACGAQRGGTDEESEAPPQAAEAPATEPIAKPEPEPVAEQISDEDDYNRAFAYGYADESYAARELDEPLHTTEYKAMLTAMLTRLAPDKLDYFNAKVTDYDVEMTRGMGAVMSWYAAVCIGTDDYNNSFESEWTDGDDGFWYKDDAIYVPLFPDCINFDFPVTVGRNTWDIEFAAAMLWNIWHSSPVSGLQTVAWDYAAESLHAQDPFTVEDAVCAVTRLSDSYLENILVPIDSAEAAGNTIDAALLQKAAASKITSMDQLPRLTGFVLVSGYFFDAKGIVYGERDIRNISDWGFTSARVPVRYETLFSEDCSEARPIELERLDSLVAAAIENGVHLNLLLTTLPGRTVRVDTEYQSGGDFDLFLNEGKQAKAVKLWQYLAERYKDVPGEYLSFTPFWEATNPDLSTGAPAPQYSAEAVAEVLDRLIAAIREKAPNRFIIYEPAPDNSVESAIRLSRPSYERVSAKYDNVRIMFNFCEQPYVYYAMIAEEGENIDLNRHGLFTPEYPLTIYAARSYIEDGKDLTLDGFLPAGTRLDLYLSRTKGNGAFTISSENGTLLEEHIPAGSYQTSYPTSIYFPYATSDKKLSVILERETKALTLRCAGSYIEWSGMDVTLPEEYAVERMYAYSKYDAYLETGDMEASDGYELRRTSTVMICPNSTDAGEHITINKDVTYTSEAVFTASNAATIDAWGRAIHDYAPEALIRYEDALMLGTEQSSILRYYDDLLAMCDKYGFGWYSKDYGYILGEYRGVAGETRTQYAGYPRFNLEMLKVLQKHQ